MVNEESFAVINLVLGYVYVDRAISYITIALSTFFCCKMKIIHVSIFLFARSNMHINILFIQKKRKIEV